MAILEQSKTYIDGVDIVKGRDITDTQDTAINANKNATTAQTKANSAEATANNALNKANEAIGKIPTFTYDESTKTLNIVTGG